MSKEGEPVYREEDFDWGHFGLMCGVIAVACLLLLAALFYFERAAE